MKKVQETPPEVQETASGLDITALHSEPEPDDVVLSTEDAVKNMKAASHLNIPRAPEPTRPPERTEGHETSTRGTPASEQPAAETPPPSVEKDYPEGEVRTLEDVLAKLDALAKLPKTKQLTLGREVEGKITAVSAAKMAGDIRKFTASLTKESFLKRPEEERFSFIRGTIKLLTSNKDLRGDLIRAFVQKGWLPESRPVRKRGSRSVGDLSGSTAEEHVDAVPEAVSSRSVVQKDVEKEKTPEMKAEVLSSYFKSVKDGTGLLQKIIEMPKAEKLHDVFTVPELEKVSGKFYQAVLDFFIQFEAEKETVDHKALLKLSEDFLATGKVPEGCKGVIRTIVHTDMVKKLSASLQGKEVKRGVTSTPTPPVSLSTEQLAEFGLATSAVPKEANTKEELQAAGLWSAGWEDGKPTSRTKAPEVTPAVETKPEPTSLAEKHGLRYRLQDFRAPTGPKPETAPKRPAATPVPTPEAPKKEPTPAPAPASTETTKAPEEPEQEPNSEAPIAFKTLSAVANLATEDIGKVLQRFFSEDGADYAEKLGIALHKQPRETQEAFIAACPNQYKKRVGNEIRTPFKGLFYFPWTQQRYRAEIVDAANKLKVKGEIGLDATSESVPSPTSESSPESVKPETVESLSSFKVGDKVMQVDSKGKNQWLEPRTVTELEPSSGRVRVRGYKTWFDGKELHKVESGTPTKPTAAPSIRIPSPAAISRAAESAAENSSGISTMSDVAKLPASELADVLERFLRGQHGPEDLALALRGEEEETQTKLLSVLENGLKEAVRNGLQHPPLLRWPGTAGKYKKALVTIANEVWKPSTVSAMPEAKSTSKELEGKIRPVEEVALEKFGLKIGDIVTSSEWFGGRVITGFVDHTTSPDAPAIFVKVERGKGAFNIDLVKKVEGESVHETSFAHFENSENTLKYILEANNSDEFLDRVNTKLGYALLDLYKAGQIIYPTSDRIASMIRTQADQIDIAGIREQAQKDPDGARKQFADIVGRISAIKDYF